jgi:hypothetical protein
MLEGDESGLPRAAGAAHWRGLPSVLLVVLLVAASVPLLGGRYARHREFRERIGFSRFLIAVDEGDLVKTQPVTITATTVRGVIRTDAGEQTFVATIPPTYDRGELVGALRKRGYDVEVA